MSRDSRLQQAVIDELNWEPSVNAAHIGVAAEAGVVTLSGHVASFAEKRVAEAAARRVRGVRGIVEKIDVRLPSEMERGDDELAAAAIDRLAWDVSVPADAIQVKVENGLITLSGQVDFHYQKNAAASAVGQLLGTVGVVNDITIKPRVDVSNVSDDIMHALNRSWFFDPKTINVTADGGKVRLTGTVQSENDRQIAAATAWAAPGVTDVENDIAIV